MAALNVKWLNNSDIEKEANNLLASFEAKHGQILSNQTPLEQITENHLGLACEVIPLENEVLGYIDIRKKVICINQSIDPSLHPQKTGRHNFTLAHEVAHWILHRHYVTDDATIDLFDAPKEPVIICRKPERKERIESQADKFAAYLLMPAPKLIRLFRTATRTKNDSLEESWLATRLRSNETFMFMNFNSYENGEFKTSEPNDDELLKQYFSSIASAFGVSKEALLYRLRDAGLLHHAEQKKLKLA